MTATLKASLFSDCVHSFFTLKTDSASWQAELIELNVRSECAKGPGNKFYEQYSLMFRVGDPGHPILNQKIYSFEHPAIGELSIFIVPVQQDEKGVYYQAVFNRLLDENERQNARA